MKVKDLLSKGFRIVKSFAMDTIAALTGGIAGVIIWRTAKGVEAAIRCSCGDCVAQQMWPFGIGEVLFSGRCENCEEHRECKVPVTSTLSNMASGLSVGEMVSIDNK